MEFLDLFLHIVFVVLFVALIIGLVSLIFYIYMLLIFKVMDDFPILAILILILFSCFLFACIAYYPFFDSVICFYNTYIFPEYLQEKYFPPIGFFLFLN